MREGATKSVEEDEDEDRDEDEEERNRSVDERGTRGCTTVRVQETAGESTACRIVMKRPDKNKYLFLKYQRKELFSFHLCLSSKLASRRAQSRACTKSTGQLRYGADSAPALQAAKVQEERYPLRS
jgi:hypothetical protein